MSRYTPLKLYLEARYGDEIRLGFAEIERIIGQPLPQSALTQRAFWSNNPSNNVMTRAWLAAGFLSEQVDLAGRSVVFRRKKEEGAVSGFKEAAQAPFAFGKVPDKLALFGWQKGTITIAPGTDLTEPADPEWALSIEGGFASSP